MSILDQYERLEELILKHTQPPVQTILRNQLALTREQIEAYQAASDKQDETLARQAQTIEDLREQIEIQNEQERFHRGIRFLKSPKTGSRWAAFCPKCRMPALGDAMPSGQQVVFCTAKCGWKVLPPISLAEIEKELT